MHYDFEPFMGEKMRTNFSKHPTPSMWRYRALLPLPPSANVPPLTVGWTPLIEAHRLAQAAGVRELWIKDDGRNPTASLKDRASAMVVAHAMQIGAEVVTTASTGNAAAALAGIAASVRLRTVIFVPAKAPEAKVAQLLAYGAEVYLVEGTYDDAFDLCLRAAQEFGWYCRNTGINPYTTEGKKTVAYEIAEQLFWKVPDVVAVSVGDGSIIGGVYKGFADLVELGWIPKRPRLIGVQAEGSAALYHTWKNGIDPRQMQPINAETLADSISSDLPRDRVKALRAVRESGGAFVTVSDAAILEAIPAVARGSGVFVEPASAATWAGILEARRLGLIDPSERVVLIGTGSGLKDVRAAMRAVSGGVRIGKTLAELQQALGNRGNL
jgi:threonine synthase